MKEMMVKIKMLLDTRLDEVPMESKFLLEFNYGKLTRSNIHDQTYWVVAMESALKQDRERLPQVQDAGEFTKKHRMNMSRRLTL